MNRITISSKCVILPALFIVAASNCFISFNAFAENKTSLTIYSTANAANITPELYSQEAQSDNAISSIPGYAIVHEQRSMDLKQGKNNISFSNISRYIDPSTVIFKSLTDPSGSKLIEQNYHFDLLSKKKLLERYLGQNIKVEQNHGNQLFTFDGKLISAADGLVLQEKNGQYRSINDYSNIRFPDLPGGLTIKPTLDWDINASKMGLHTIDISYQTGGITWWADYNAIFEEGQDPNNGFINLNAWVSILNQTGINYDNAKLNLVAGNVNHLPTLSGARPLLMAATSKAGNINDVNSFSEQPFFEYYLYSLNGETTILNNTTKQIELFSSTPRTPVIKEYYYRGTNEMPFYGSNINMNRDLPGPKNSKIEVVLKLKNDKEQGLGFPLPAGRVRVTKLDKQTQTMEFIGENKIGHTPKGETLNIKVGNAFDLMGDRKQLDFFIDKDKHIIKETFEISIKNRKDQSVNVVIVEHLNRGDSWKILDTASDYQKIDAHTIHFPVKVDKNSETKIQYTVEYTW